MRRTALSEQLDVASDPIVAFCAEVAPLLSKHELDDAAAVRALSMTLCTIGVSAGMNPDDLVARVRNDWPHAALAQIELLQEGDRQ
jgi:hypothetical protein